MDEFCGIFFDRAQVSFDHANDIKIFEDELFVS
jgi:hypothetical protein